MAISPSLEERLRQRRLNPAGPKPRRGEEIFAGTDYPRDFSGFIGQEQAKEQLTANLAHAMHNGVRLDHTLLASGLHGIGKTTLAYILANQARVGITAVSGPLTVQDARSALTAMQDGDILFWDEFHLAVSGNKNRADWLLPLLTDGELMTPHGAEPMPEVTVVAATTDIGKLNNTIISRFMIKPRLVAYTAHEATRIAGNLATRMKVDVDPSDWKAIADAANRNPRDMRMILTAIRDLTYARADGGYDLRKAFEWAGLSYDGLTTVAQEMMLVLLASKNHTASIESIQAQLGEPGPLRHHEQTLLQKGFLTVTGRGRVLTEEGVERANLLIDERNAA